VAVKVWRTEIKAAIIVKLFG